MRRKKVPVRFTGQHFTINPIVIEDAIRFAKLTRNDITLDIGAGRGSITTSLARVCSKIIAIEKDRDLVSFLRKKFTGSNKIKVIEADIRQYHLPEMPFKTVSNIPYHITADILKRLMFEYAEHFRGGTLVMQLESAQKLVMKRIFNPYTILYRTFFDIRLMYEVPQGSFLPPPKVRSALIRIERKETVGICITQKRQYLDFLIFMLKFPNKSIRVILKTIFRKQQVREVSNQYQINPDSDVVDLSVYQWAGCFRYMVEKVPRQYHPRS